MRYSTQKVSVPFNPTLMGTNLFSDQRNRIGDEGAKYFADALKINKVKYLS
jgi:hypothetical protein